MTKTKQITKRVNLNISLRPWQKRAYNVLKTKKRMVLNVHRGGGKTWLAMLRLCESALFTKSATGGPAKFFYIGQSQSHAKQTVWDILKFILQDYIDAGLCSVNSNDLTITFKNEKGRDCNMIMLSGIDNAEKVRGSHVHGLVLDEAQGCSVETWEKIISPTLRQNDGWSLLLGTPNGPDLKSVFYKQWLAGLDEGNIYWESLKFTVEDTGEISEEAWNELLTNTDRASLLQEYFCSFDAAVKNRTYYNFDPAINQDSNIVDRGGDLYVGMDFNISHFPLAIGQRTDRGIEIFHEVILQDRTTEDACEWLKHHYPDRRIIVCPDASGAARTTGQTVGSNHQILQRAGFIVRSPSKNPRVLDRVQQVNVALRNGHNQAKLFIHPRCTNLHDSLMYQENNQYTGQPDKTKGLDHMADALGYLVNIVAPTAKASKMKVRPLSY